MKIALGSDHHGVPTRVKIAEFLRQEGHDVTEFGPTLENCESVDYPDVAAVVAQNVSQQKIDRGVLICGTGI
jgi:ribose 5-phosphate isomerase B